MDFTQFPGLDDSYGEDWQDFVEQLNPGGLGLDLHDSLFHDLPRQEWSPGLHLDRISEQPEQAQPSRAPSAPRSTDTNPPEPIIESRALWAKPLWEAGPAEKGAPWRISDAAGERASSADVETLQHRVQALEER